MSPSLTFSNLSLVLSTSTLSALSIVISNSETFFLIRGCKLELEISGLLLVSCLKESAKELYVVLQTTSRLRFLTAKMVTPTKSISGPLASFCTPCFLVDLLSKVQKSRTPTAKLNAASTHSLNSHQSPTMPKTLSEDVSESILANE